MDKEDVHLERIDKVMGALNRITEIVKKIEDISESDMEETSYSGDVNRFKLKWLILQYPCLFYSSNLLNYR